MVGRGGWQCMWRGAGGDVYAIYACLTFTLLLRDVQHILSGGKNQGAENFVCYIIFNLKMGK